MRPLRAVAVAGVCFVVAGCGGGDDSSPATVRTVTVTATAGSVTEVATTTGVTKSEAEALAKSMVLRLSDFPTGWRSEQPKDDDEGCAGIDKLTDRYDILAKVDSDDFSKGEATQASSTSTLFAEEASARDALNYIEGSIQSDRFRDCLVDFFRDQDLTVSGDVSVGQVSFPMLGDRSSAWEIVAPLESDGVSVTAFYDAVYIRTGKALSVVLFADAFTPFDEALREQLARRVAERMDAAAEELA